MQLAIRWLKAASFYGLKTHSGAPRGTGYPLPTAWRRQPGQEHLRFRQPSCGVPVTTNSSAAAGRILLAVLFILGGVSKLGNPAGTQAYIASVGLPFPLLAYIVALVVEIGGGVLLLIGYRTRVVAIVLVVFTLTAAVFFHHVFSDKNQFIHFMKNLAISGGLLQVVAFGAGGFSIDGRRRATTAPTLG